MAQTGYCDHYVFIGQPDEPARPVTLAPRAPGFRIPAPPAFDPAKLAAAQASCDLVARACGWVR